MEFKGGDRMKKAKTIILVALVLFLSGFVIDFFVVYPWLCYVLFGDISIIRAIDLEGSEYVFHIGTVLIFVAIVLAIIGIAIN